MSEAEAEAAGSALLPTLSVPRTRDDLVGKRFLLVGASGASRTSSVQKLKVGRAPDWPWKAGRIRCSSHLDLNDPELQVGKIR